MTTDGVQRGKPNGVSVIVAGAGVGGLMAGLECWRAGCDVRVMERNKKNVPTGDSFAIGPTAINSFRNWPWLKERNQEVGYKPLFAVHSQKGIRLTKPKTFPELVAGSEGEPEREMPRHLRPKFHEMLLDQLIRVGVDVEFDCEAEEFFEEPENNCAGIVLKDGSRHTADLVIASDGLRSKSWKVVGGKQVPARNSGNAIYRVAYPASLITEDPELSERFCFTEEGKSIMELWVG